MKYLHIQPDFTDKLSSSFTPLSYPEKFAAKCRDLALRPALLSCLLAPGVNHSGEIGLQSLSLRANLSSATTLGAPQPEEFEEYDLAVNVSLPWQYDFVSGWRLGSRLMGSAGILRGGGEDGAVVSFIPELTIGSADERFLIDIGAGAALLSKSRFGTQDFGGPFQFALTVGVAVPIYKQWGVGYRFLHYSDAGINGSNTVGVDNHMLEIYYRF